MKVESSGGKMQKKVVVGRKSGVVGVISRKDAKAPGYSDLRNQEHLFLSVTGG
jgi:hypothetical protein